MVSPLTGGIAPQIPAANTFQPGGSDSARRVEQEKVPDSTRSTQSDAARSAPSETKNNGRQELQATSSRSQDTGGVSASRSRGTELDITV